MNLQKASDKTDRNKLDDLQTTNTNTKSESETNSLEWVSPVYSSSVNININKAKAIENRCVSLNNNAPEIDFYKIIRTQILQKTNTNKRNLIMVTSTNPGEGKTITAINLAITFAKEFKNTVLLVDCDLKQQKIHQYLGLPGEKGISDYILNNIPVDKLIIWPGIEKLSLISGGSIIKDSAELINSPKMKFIINEMKNRYDNRYIFFDVPPILKVADAVAFAPLVDSILLVVQAGKTDINDIKKAIDLIPKEKFLGFVFNRNRLDNKIYRPSHK